MNFYQELQLNQAGSKSYIASFKNQKINVSILLFIYSKLHWLLLFVFLCHIIFCTFWQ